MPTTPLHDWTGSPFSLRLLRVQQLRSGDREPLAGTDFNNQVEHLSTEEERRETGDRLRRLRRAS